MMKKAVFILFLSTFLMVKNAFGQEIFSILFGPFSEASFDLENLHSLGLSDTIKVYDIDTPAIGMVVVNCYFINNADGAVLFGLSVNRVIFEDSNKKRVIINPLEDVLALSISDKVLNLLNGKKDILRESVRISDTEGVSKTNIVLRFKVEN